MRLFIARSRRQSFCWVRVRFLAARAMAVHKRQEGRLPIPSCHFRFPFLHDTCPLLFSSSHQVFKLSSALRSAGVDVQQRAPTPLTFRKHSGLMTASRDLFGKGAVVPEKEEVENASEGRQLTQRSSANLCIDSLANLFASPRPQSGPYADQQLYCCPHLRP